jgi:predicted Zn-dependent protease
VKALDLADRVLGWVEGDGQVTVTAEHSLFARFARSAPTQSTAVEGRSVHVLCVVEGRTGGSTASSLDEDDLRDAARRAREAAEAAARGAEGDYPGLAAPAPAPSYEGYDDETARLDPASAGAALAAAFAAAAEAGFEAYGLWTAGATETAIASTAGLRSAERATDAYLKVVCRDERGRSGWGSAAGRSVGEIDGDAVARAATSRVPRADPVPVPPGEYPVVLDHDAVGTLLDMLGYVAFNGLAHAEGRGALVERLGTAVAAPAVDLTDDPGAAFPRAFDFEGVPKAPLPLLEGGVARAVAHDQRSAALAGTTSTGHALAPGGSAWGPAPTNLSLAGGDAASVEELAAGIERGLLVTRLWYLNPVHERTALVTGVTRDGTFWIEDGALALPARDVRFTDSALRILEATEALTSRRKLVSEAEFYGTRFAFGSVVPALRAGGFRVSGGA